MSGQPSFNVVIIYDDFYSALRGQELAGRMAIELEPAFEIRTRVWDFDLASHPDLRDRAAKDAIEADMIIISVTSEAGLSSSFKAWMESWLAQKRGGLAALVALVSEGECFPAEPPPLCRVLKQMAREGGMDFFCQTGICRNESFECAFEPVHRHGVGSHVALGEIPYSGLAWRGRG